MFFSKNRFALFGNIASAPARSPNAVSETK